MVVQHNLSAMNANRYLGINNSKLSKSLEKLSSGYAINRAGDNAAGLAVSEKMRSQIAGMTQGVKNAQDGISMVQTFEGALTETDSILQRMKTLADQMANGTYDDPVDRNAAQNEFDQLNDELNQIADTDFNGVICLNGGVMADGLEAVDGKFDYANKASQAQAKIDAQVAELEKQKADLGEVPTDLLSAKDADGNNIWNSLDDHGYQAAEADALWTALGLDADKISDVSVTYTAKVAADGTVSYEATSAVASDGTALTDLDQFAATATSNTDASGLGGFKIAGIGATDSPVQAIFDATKIENGSVITIKFDGPGSKAKAPTTVGIANDSIKVTGTVDPDETHYKVSIGELKDEDMTADVKKALDALNGKEMTFNVALNAKAPATGADVAIAGSTLAAAGTGYADATNKLFIAVAGGKVTISTLAANGTSADKTIAEIDFNDATAVAATGTAGTVKMTLAIDSYTVPGATPVDAEPIATDLGEETNALAAKKAAIDAQIKAVKAGTTGVSVSDSYDNAAIPLTYTDNITLQTGARSKDAVKFTFKYASEGGIGELESNMNCSAREGGLNTENLSIATAKDANHAIDRIDHAINKVSMVRATFGAIQNRLEHKIDNLNVSIENLTSAESQIRDTNMPQEMMNFTKQQILAQASQSMLAQANQLPQGVLSLLQ